METRTSYQRQRRQRGRARIESHRYYLKRRARNKVRAKQRYRRMRNNSSFKRHQKLYRLHPGRFHRRMAADVELMGLPFWSSSMGDGIVVAVDDDEVFVLLAHGSGDVESYYFQDFLDTVTFIEETDIDTFFNAMDAAMGVSIDAAAVSDAMVRMLDGEAGAQGP